MIICTGRRSALPGALVNTVRGFMAEDKNGGVIVLVPDQLTLETEIMLFRELNLAGSFTVNVLSPKRLCGRVFEEAGKSFPAAIDEMGRAMIMGYLLRKNAGRLTFFKNAAQKTGFETRIVSEIRNFKQAHTEPKDLLRLIRPDDTQARRDKLTDIAMLYEEYENHLSGHIQDGEGEIREACSRMSASPFVSEARVVVYGFDITTPVVNNLICSLAVSCRELRVLLPLANGGRGVYQPMDESITRLIRLTEKEHIGVEMTGLPEPATGTDDIACLANGIYDIGSPAYSGEIRSVEMAKLSDELEEARFAAATVRKLVRERGWRYSDIRVVCCDSEISQDTLETAFSEYEVPFFTQEGRSAASNPLCVFLNETLRLISGKTCSVHAMLGTGFADVTRDEGEMLIKYLNALQLRSTALNSPFTRGIRKDRRHTSLVEQAEPIRAKLMKPVTALKNRLKQAEDLKTQLAAVYEFLEEADCRGKAERKRRLLQECGMGEAAADDAQIWNKLMSTLDQLLYLLGPDPLPVSTISDLIDRAMTSLSVKQLPLSPDCVEISSPGRMGMTAVKAVLMTGMVQESGGANRSVFTREEMRDISKQLDKYLGPSAEAQALTRKMYIKDLLALADEYVLVSYHSSNLSGEAVGAGFAIAETKRILKGITVIGDNLDDQEVARRLLSSREGARAYLAPCLHSTEKTELEKAALKALGDDEVISRAMNARSFEWKSGRITPELASKLYGSRISVSRLESYAKCPFASFVKNGLKPDENEVYELNSRDRGNILHECVELLGKELSVQGLSEEAAQQRMDAIADELLARPDNADVLGYTAISKAAADEIKKTARRSARIFARQAQNRRFTPVKMEMQFGDKGEFTIALSTGQEIVFNGKIDRVDKGTLNGKTYVSIIDYKSSGKDVKPGELYLGMQLQLIIYLSIALKEYNAASAGVYYFNLKDQLLKTDVRSPELVTAEKQKNERLNGIVPDDAELLRFMADDPGSVFEIALKGDNVGIKSSPKATEEEFERLIKYIKFKAAELTEEMYGGNTEIKPAGGGDGTACMWCRYNNVCFKSNMYLPKEKADKKISSMNDLHSELREWEAKDETVQS